ncbi:ribosomal protein L25-like protein, partial [Rozella allomycis CSF55]
MAVIDPIKVVLTDFPENEIEEFEIKDEISGTRKIPFSKIIYIDQSDFRLEDDPNFKRLAPGKSVCLMFSHDAKKTTADKSYRITCTDYIQDENGKVTQLMAICDRGVNHKTKAPARIQWVAESPLHNSPIKAQVNLYSNLFLHENPSSNPDGWLADVNPNSLEIKTAFV